MYIKTQVEFGFNNPENKYFYEYLLVMTKNSIKKTVNYILNNYEITKMEEIVIEHTMIVDDTELEYF